MTDNVRDEAARGAPDVEGDEAVAAYEAAKLRYIRAVTQDAEAKLYDAFAKRREAINAEIGDLRELAKRRGDAANAAAAAYAKRLPHRVRKTGVRPPSIVERLRSLNAIDDLYRDAVKAAAELDDVNDLLRKRRERLDAMERETRRSIYLREEAVRKKLQTPEGLAALHADPMVKAAFGKMQGVMNERAKFDERVKRGDIVPEEARDRDMAQRGRQFATVPLQAVMIAGLVRYGPLEYYVLRDLIKHEFLLSCDPALAPLREYVFDLTHSPAGYEAALRHTTSEVPMRVIDHLKATFTANEATEFYALHRASMRTERPSRTTPPRDDTEAEMIAMLRLLAQAIASHGVPDAGEAIVDA